MRGGIRSFDQCEGSFKPYTTIVRLSDGSPVGACPACKAFVGIYRASGKVRAHKRKVSE